MDYISIGDRIVGNDHPAFIIAEVAQAHDGSLGTAHAYIDAVSEIGVDAIKFQTHLAEFESTRDEPFRVNFSYQDETRFDYWRRMEFSIDQWRELARHCRENALVFLSSPFSVRAVKMLESIGMPAWKIGSGELQSIDLMNEIVKSGAPVLLSTGMSTLEEIRNAVGLVRERGIPLAVFQCTSEYPTPFKDVGLNMIGFFKEEFQCPVGLSDHSGSVFPGLAALARGVNFLEVHVTFDKRLFGPDMSASITIEDLKFLSKARDVFFEMDQHPVDKDGIAVRLSEMRASFGKSLAPARPLAAGTMIRGDMLVEKKPGTGIPCSEKGRIIGLRLKRDVMPDRLLMWEDIDE